LQWYELQVHEHHAVRIFAATDDLANTLVILHVKALNELGQTAHVVLTS
jgi:hypothetical protein